MYKMLAMDLDGTLLNNQNQVSEYNKKMVRRAREEGLYILLISGRPYRHIQNVAKELGLNECFIVAFGGADIREYPSGRSIVTRCLTREDVDLLFGISVKLNCYMQIFRRNGDFYFKKEEEFSRIYGEYFNHPGSLLTDEIYKSDDFCKASFMTKYENVPKLIENIKPMLPGCLRVTPSYFFVVDVYRSESDKGTALRYIADKCGIARSEIVAMGDEGNDIPLFKEAGLKVAMANAADALKKEADVIAPTNEENGVGEIIKQYILCR